MSARGAGTSQAEKKPADQGRHIILIKVEGQDGIDMFCSIRTSVQLWKIMNAYCDHKSIEFSSVAFLFNGRRLRGEQTPDEVDMVDGDKIDVMMLEKGW